MSSLFSAPMSPNLATADLITAPARPPPAPLPPAAPAPIPSSTLAALAAPTAATDPALAAQIDPTAAAANAIAMRYRGIGGTIATSLTGAPLEAANSAAADGFNTNALLPRRKTLLGE